MTPCSPLFEVRVRKVHPDRPEAEAIAWAASIVGKGGIVIYPTETFYGLGGDPVSQLAIERIYGVKGRDFLKPLPLIASDMNAVLGAVSRWPPKARGLAERFWPGPLTMVLPASPHLPRVLHAGTGKIAVRISSHPVALALAASTGGLLIATSANIAGEPACEHPGDLPPSLLCRVDGVLDAGRTPGQLPSTIVDLSVEPPRLIREGCLPWARVAGSMESWS